VKVDPELYAHIRWLRDGLGSVLPFASMGPPVKLSDWRSGWTGGFEFRDLDLGGWLIRVVVEWQDLDRLRKLIGPVYPTALITSIGNFRYCTHFRVYPAGTPGIPSMAEVLQRSAPRADEPTSPSKPPPAAPQERRLPPAPVTVPPPEPTPFKPSDEWLEHLRIQENRHRNTLLCEEQRNPLPFPVSTLPARSKYHRPPAERDDEELLRRWYQAGSA
jgi:hypothetical protein